MMIVGLTGSIAMGKSEVAKTIKQLGIPVFDADAEVHKLYDSAAGAKLLYPLVPEAIIDHRIDREILSTIVLKDPQKLTELETIVHGEIAKKRINFLTRTEKHGHKIAVLDIPLLFEKNMAESVDLVVVVSAPEHLQRQRALLRPRMTQARLEMILSRQMHDQEKRQRADFILENNGTLLDLLQQTKSLFSKLLNPPKKP